jgi:peptide/nickel transport system permease protein
LVLILLGYSQSYRQKKTLLKKDLYLGTDKYGRDLLSRMLIGSRVSISIGVVAVLISLIVGIFWLIGGYFEGKWMVIMWLVNIIWSIPTLLLVIAITLALGKGFGRFCCCGINDVG